MPVLLVLTVGGAPEPIAASLACRDPEPVERALFVCSAASRSSLGVDQPPLGAPVRSTVVGLARELGCELRPAQFDIVTISNHQDLTGCVEQIRRALDPQVRSWLGRGAGYLVVADITGGTKCMSVALGLVARRWQCLFRYVGGQERTREGVGIVVNGKEQILYGQNPWDALGFEVAEQAFTLFDSGDCGAAERLLKDAKCKAKSPHVTRALAAAESLAAGFAAWDRFDHRTARTHFQNSVKGSHDLAWFVGEDRAAAIRRVVESWLARVPPVEEPRTPSRELLIDLLANAGRRRRELRFDDAVARLYRSVELMAQIRLLAYGIKTKAVPLDRIPEGCRAPLEAEAVGGVVACGLQAAYRLLECLGDELGCVFRKLLPLPGKGCLEARNNSILAHGFDPAGEKSCKDVWDLAISLANIMGIVASDLPEFPRLGS